MGDVAVAVIDVGSNSVRLLVAIAGGNGIQPLREERAYPGLGAEIEAHGEIRAAKLDELSRLVRRFAADARKAGAQRVEALVTAPGRQAANADDMLDAVAHAARIPVRILTAEEEGALAFRGALLRASDVRGLVAVCDVGGGSTEIAVGEAPGSPSWIRSVDVGALRLTTALLHGDPPTDTELARARAAAREAFAPLTPPRPEVALAVGGSARALARLVGRELDRERLERALELVASRRAAKLARSHGIAEHRARVLPAGAIILGEVARTLGTPLRLAGGGLREGAVAGMLAERLAA
jgi:exopolyphosphatase/guanosine-5'-triphosphate,3'-diphosphate pyrophosphatase